MSGSSTLFTAVVLAGDRSSEDPVARVAGVRSKSLIPVGGTPMVLRVIDALEAAREIEKVILCGPEKSAVDQEQELRLRVDSGKVRWLESKTTPSFSTHHAMQSLSDSTLVLVTTADHALLTAEMVNYFCSTARKSNKDVVVGLALHELVRAKYPETKRTAIQLADGSYCSCNLFGFLTPEARSAAYFWRKVESQRKKTLRVIAGFGWLNLLLYLLKRPSLEEGLDRISQRLGLRAGAVIMPFPEAAVDVDTVSDWELVESIVANRTG
ncbi:MAG: nucleotidyltransferase family protein [Syntrophobacterales bacterium]|jgi:molybdopterin-guanine dinucleotide biosynthesis protein A